MKVSYTAAELMEVALMCLSSDATEYKPPKKTEFYCHSCKRLVKKDEAEICCWPSGHDVETGEDAA